MLLDSIRTQLDSLSKSERKVALAVLDHPGQTVSQNITALAKSAQVSEPTVVRFAARWATTAGMSSSSSWRRAWRWPCPA